MLRTISVGPHIQIQGLFVRTCENGNVVVAVGDRNYEGKLIKRLN